MAWLPDALATTDLQMEHITHWCIHPGGRKILEAVHNCLGFTNGQLSNSYDVLKSSGNMSSPTVLFVLEKIMHSLKANEPAENIWSGLRPGHLMETFILSS
jgi:predicted naringenin-chalcone synthase